MKMRMNCWMLMGVVVAGCSGSDEPVRVEGTEPGDCTDGADNDTDGDFDCDDDGCSGSPDCETSGDTDTATPGDTGDTDTDTDTDTGQACRSVVALDGSDSHVSTDLDLSWSNAEAFTVAAWIRPEASVSTHGWVGKPEFEWSLLGFTDRSVGFTYWYVGGNTQLRAASAEGLVELDVWSHLAATFDGGTGTLSVYLNGQPVASATAEDVFSDSATGISVGGAYPREAEGRVADVRIWSVALTATEIAAVAAAPGAGPGTSLVAAWPLDDGTGTARNTISGDDVGTLDGATWVEDCEI